MLLFALLIACGDSASPTTPTLPPPPPPAAAGHGQHQLHPCEIFRATGELEERQEIGARTKLSRAPGSNRLEANSSRQEVWGLIFRATIKSGRRLTVTVGFTDDAGNDINEVTNFIFR